MTTALDIIALPVNNDARKALRACADLPMLEEALRMEEAKPGQVGDKGGPRASMLGILKLRIDMLRASVAPVPAPATTTTAPAITVAPAPQVQAPAAPPVLVAPPAPAPVVAAEPVAQAPTNPVQDCATTFMLALRDGDARLLTMLVGVVRDRDYTSEQVAEALVGAYKAQAPASTRTVTRRVATATTTAVDGATATASERNVGRLQAAVKGAQTVDGTLVLDEAAMLGAGFPASWVAHATCWYGKDGAAGLAARAIGYVPKHIKRDGAPRVVLTPIAPE